MFIEMLKKFEERYVRYNYIVERFIKTHEAQSNLMADKILR